MTATPAYVLSCEGRPAGLDACGTQFWGPVGLSVPETRRIAEDVHGWLTKYGDLCPECWPASIAATAPAGGA